MYYSLVCRRSLRGAIINRISQLPWLSRSFCDPNTRPDSPKTNPSKVTDTLTSYFNDWKKALEFFHWVESPEFSHTTETYNKMIDILGKYFEFELSWDLINRMSKFPNSPPNHATFRIVYKRYVSVNMVKEAINTFHKLEQFNLKDQTSFTDLIDALCEYKHVFNAYDLCFPNNTGFQTTTQMCNMILRGYSKVMYFEKCWSFWDEMDERGFEKDIHSYSIYMDIHIKARKPWKALEVYRDMIEKNIKLDTVAYNTVINAAGLKDGADFSIRALKEMIEEGIKPSTASYNIVIKLLCEEHRFGDARQMFDEMRMRNCEPNVITYHCVFRSMKNAKEIMVLFDRMVWRNVRPRVDTFVLLMRKFQRKGFLRPMMIVWKGMRKLGVSPNDHAYNVMIDALIEKKLLNLAKKFDEAMMAKGLSARPRPNLGSKRPHEKDGD